jgi:hypothetical protein
MTTRYFVKIDMDETVRWLARFDMETMSTQAWNGTEWIQSDTVMDSIVRGDPLFDELPEAQARTIMPAAFNG